MSPSGVIKVFNAKNNRHSIGVVILVGERGFWGGGGHKVAFCVISTDVPYLVDNKWSAVDKSWPSHQKYVKYTRQYVEFTKII